MECYVSREVENFFHLTPIPKKLSSVPIFADLSHRTRLRPLYSPICGDSFPGRGVGIHLANTFGKRFHISLQLGVFIQGPPPPTMVTCANTRRGAPDKRPLPGCGCSTKGRLPRRTGRSSILRAPDCLTDAPPPPTEY